MVLPVLGVLVFVLGLTVAYLSGATNTTPSPEVQPAVAAPVADLPLEGTDLRPFDPEGNDQEHGADLPFLIDNSRETFWRTETYSREDFGGLKDGVGFVIDLGEPATVDAVILDVPAQAQGFGVELRTADEVPADLEDTVEVVPSQIAGESVELRPAEALRARYLVVWITSPLPEVGSQPNPYRASVSEVNVLGTRGAPPA
jgi:putative peptidoglycan lipid II flippase